MKKMKFRSLVIVLFLSYLFVCIDNGLMAKTYYVSTTGNDIYPGTFEQPWGTWQKAFDMAKEGDIVYFRGGVWHPTKYAAPKLYPGQGHGNNGTRGNPICFFNYPGEVPILDCSNIEPEYGNINYGIDIIQAEFIHFKGLTIRNLYGRTNPILAVAVNANQCCNLTFENMTVYNISGRGFFYMSGAWESWENETISPFPNETDTLRFINCDAYNLCDSVSNNPGNAADGWWCAGYKQGYFYWEGCRAWNYSDDGIDSYGSQTRHLSNCWVMGTKKYESMECEGNGFKMAGCRYEPDANEHKVIITNCIAAFCDANATNGNIGSGGFYTNLYSGANGNYQQNCLLYNNTAYHCGTGFIDLVISGTPRTSVFKNNISYGSLSTGYGQNPLYEVAIYRPSVYNESNNNWVAIDYPGEQDEWPGWQYSNMVTVTDADFVSLDSAQLHGARKSDGSLPDIDFLKLASGSDLIDAGVDVGLPYEGRKPDLGAFENGGIIVTGEGGSNQIGIDNGSLQLTATILSEYDESLGITWSVENHTGQASINNEGIVSAIGNGTITARATLNDGSGISGSLMRLYSNLYMI